MGQFVKDSMGKLNKMGYKNTKRRNDMLAIFDTEENPYLTAKDVQERLKPEYPGLSFDTIYRNLKLFSKYNILEETEVSGEMAFRRNCEEDLGHHHHFICLNCGQVTPIVFSDKSFFEDILPGYKVVNHEFRLEGICPACLEQMKDEEEIDE